MHLKGVDAEKDALVLKDPTPPSRSISETSLSSSTASSVENSKSSSSSRLKPMRKFSRSKSSLTGADDNTFDRDERKCQDGMAFSHLG